ncbi:MAG: glycoside hydrolase family 32 protein [Kiritimatiellaeota bacterium]|nr:glycoside hydrolase family 32 protein [Kiritimatiellota bacterium]
MKQSIARVVFVLLVGGMLLVGAAAAPAAEVLHHDADAIGKAREGVEQEIPVAKADPTRPVYHFVPEARWMNDPNGCFFAGGWFHVFYQLNPYGNDWGRIHWGHARSRDNVTWEHLPVAIWPSTEKGEHHCGSGSAVQDGNGNWQMWYTSITGRGKDFSVPARFNGQVLVKPLDKDFIKWGKATDDPVNRPTLPGNIDGYAWGNYLRDSTFLKAGGRTFMVLGITGSDEVGGNSAPIYEAKNKLLTEWTYRGKMFNQAWDCPQMIPFGEKWLYVMTQDTPPQWFTGTFDPATAKFTSESGGRLDRSGEYKTISFATDDRGRHIVYCWIHPTKQAKGWNNCFALPRVLTLDKNGHPAQAPVPELAKLRGEHVGMKNLTGAKVLDIKGDTLEIKAIFENLDKGNSGLKVRRSDDGSRALEIRVMSGGVDVFGTHLAAQPEGEKKAISVHVFLDKSIIEVFVNGGKQTVARVMVPPLEDLGVEAFSAGTASVDVWRMKSIW